MFVRAPPVTWQVYGCQMVGISQDRRHEPDRPYSPDRRHEPERRHAPERPYPQDRRRSPESSCESETSTPGSVTLPSGRVMDLHRSRWDGVLDREEYKYCRQHGIALGYDCTQIGWVIETCTDESSAAPPRPVLPGPAVPATTADPEHRTIELRGIVEADAERILADVREGRMSLDAAQLRLGAVAAAAMKGFAAEHASARLRPVSLGASVGRGRCAGRSAGAAPRATAGIGRDGVHVPFVDARRRGGLHGVVGQPEDLGLLARTVPIAVHARHRAHPDRRRIDRLPSRNGGGRGRWPTDRSVSVALRPGICRHPSVRGGVLVG